MPTEKPWDPCKPFCDGIEAGQTAAFRRGYLAALEGCRKIAMDLQKEHDTDGYTCRFVADAIIAHEKAYREGR